MAEPRFRFRREKLAWRLVGDEGVVLDLGTKRIFFLNRTAAVLWERLSDSASVDDLARELAEPCRRDPASIAGDIQAFVDQLISADLVLDAVAGDVATSADRSPTPNLEYLSPRITEEDLAFFTGLGCGKSAPTTFECTRALRDS